jgi:hypothetical protein
MAEAAGTDTIGRDGQRGHREPGPARRGPVGDGRRAGGHEDGRGGGLRVRSTLVLVLLGIAALLSFGALRHQAQTLEIIHGPLGFPLELGVLSAHTLAGFWALALKLLTVVGILGLRNAATRDWRSGVAFLLGIGLDLFFQTRGYQSYTAGFAAAVPALTLAMAVWLFEVPTFGGRRRRQDRADEGAASEAGHAEDVWQPPSGVATGQPAPGPVSPPPRPPAAANLSQPPGPVISQELRTAAPADDVRRAGKAARERARRAWRAGRTPAEAAADYDLDPAVVAELWPQFQARYGPQPKPNGQRPPAGVAR